MRFDIKKRENPSYKGYSRENLAIARTFSKKLYDEFGNFISALVLFGSTARSQQKSNDIDILVVLDDVRVIFTQELVETYRILTEKTIAKINPDKLHVHSMTLTSFWEYMRNGDPVAINILRDGISLIDNGFFDPLKVLLADGRIRPSTEAVYNYYNLAPASILRAKQSLLNAAVNLYWGVIDSAHAALMSEGEIPPSPDHVAEIFDKRLVKTGKIKRKYKDILNDIYLLSKKIIHREKKELTGREYDKYKAMAEEFIKEIRKYLEKK